MALRVIKYYDDGYRVAIVVKEGHKWDHIVPNDAAGLRVVRMANDTPYESHVLDADVCETARTFLKRGERYGITEEARRALEALINLED